MSRAAGARLAGPFRTATLSEYSPRAFVRAIVSGDFIQAESIFNRVPAQDQRIPGLRRLVPPDLAGRVRVVWRPNLGERILSYVGGEGVKGPWCVVVDRERVIIGFDDDDVINPAAQPEALAILRRIGWLK